MEEGRTNIFKNIFTSFWRPKAHLAEELSPLQPNKRVEFASQHLIKSTDNENEILHFMFDDTKLEKRQSFRPLTVATMTRDDGIPQARDERKRLQPDDCYLIWSTTFVGRFGAFYEAAEGPKLKPVTLKVYRPKIFGDNGSEMEKRILSDRVKPQCIPSLIRAFRYEFQDVLVMERLEMYPLQYLLWHYWRLSSQDAMVYFSEMVLAVGFLHSRNIIHRNLYLGSFWIQSSGHLKLVDYSRCIEGQGRYYLSGEHVTNYTAPELVQRGVHTKMVDIWALGIILYKMITGYMPFRGESRKELIDCIKNKQERYCKLFPPLIAVLCHKLLLKSPFQRFAYGRGTLMSFKTDPVFDKVKWTRIFEKPFYHGDLHCAQVLGDESLSRGSIVHLDLMAQTKMSFRRKKKPLRFKDITTRSGVELFNENVLLRDSSQEWSIGGAPYGVSDRDSDDQASHTITLNSN